jgi:hypothetical protein
MGKKKKTYVKPEMKIIEVKTEGVIAASGAIEIPDEYIEDFLENSCTTGGAGGNALKALAPGECTPSGFLKVNANGGSCSAQKWYGKHGFTHQMPIIICKSNDGLKYTIEPDRGINK